MCLRMGGVFQAAPAPAAAEDTEEVDESGVEAKDVELVMTQVARLSIAKFRLFEV